MAVHQAGREVRASLRRRIWGTRFLLPQTSAYAAGDVTPSVQLLAAGAKEVKCRTSQYEIFPVAKQWPNMYS
jgi:hypothetical protein